MLHWLVFILSVAVIFGVFLVSFPSYCNGTVCETRRLASPYGESLPSQRRSDGVTSVSGTVPTLGVPAPPPWAIKASPVATRAFL